MKTFFLHPTVKKVCYVVGLLTLAGWLLSGFGKGFYYGADYMGWIPDHVKDELWHEDRKSKWRERRDKRFRKFCEELDDDIEDDIPTTEGTQP